MQQTLENAPIHYCQKEELCIERKKMGRGFRYIDENGNALTDSAFLNYIKQLRIPPAWHNVQISKHEDSHIVAIGYDDKNRKQYIYHPEWNKLQQENKFNKMIHFGEVLPELRKKVTSDMNIKGLKRERVVSTVVWLLENTFIRVGNKEYAKQNNSYGLTTLREKHIEVEDDTVKFEFKGKSGVYHSVDIEHKRVARTIQKCIDLPGYEIFQYIDAEGRRQIVESKDVNDYLKSATGEMFTAKDFRTWGGTVLAGSTLHQLGPFNNTTAAKKNVTQAVKAVTKHLRNTPATCRSYYIHPGVIHSYQEKVLIPHFDEVYKNRLKETTLYADEYASWTLIKEISIV